MPPMPATPIRDAADPRARRRGERGTALVEFGLVLLPFLALVFLILDVSWCLFAKATIQEAVREGVRVGVTATAGTGCSNVTCTVQATVMKYSLGFVTNPNNVTVTYYSPSSGTLSPVTGSQADIAGNIIEVSVSGVMINSLGLILRAGAPVSIGATASDVIESNSSRSAP